MRTAFFMPFPGTFLTVVGVVTGFLNFLYTGVEKYKRCIFPHPAYIYFIKMPANPDNPSRFVFFSSLKGRFSCLSKRPCVQFKTHLRLRSNALAF